MDALTVAAAIAKLADVDPCGTVTDAGMLTAELDFDRTIVTPPDAAAAVNNTVPVAVCPLVIVLGATEMLLRAAGMGLIVRVAVTVLPE